MTESHHLGEPVSPGPQHGRRASTASGRYDAPDSYRNLDDSLAPISRPPPQHAATFPPATFPPEHQRRRSHSRPASAASQADYNVPDTYANLGETADVSPVQNPYEEPIRRFRSLEQVRSREQQFAREQKLRRRQSLAEGQKPEQEKPEEGKFEVSRLATQLYTVSYLILFSIFGTLARLGLQALTTYPGTPIIFSSIWPNFAGSLVMGFLSEDRMLFREAQEQSPSTDEENGNGTTTATTAKQAHAALKKTIPLYIGLATGFCGSFTSFSAFVRDMFLALSNDLPPTSNPTTPRNGGYSFLALVSVPLITISLSLSALFLGAHLAIALAPLTPSLSRGGLRTFLDRSAVLLGWGCWLLGAVLLSALPPGGHGDWRGKVTFALVFAPLGCLARFFVSLRLNGRVASFPLGTFVVNLAGTGVLALAWDLAHSSAVGVGAGGGGGGAPLVGCQVLAGVQDGFCGCLTTVSTWVGELAALRRRHAYVYGGASVLGGLAVVVAVMGGLRWSGGYEWGACG